MRRLIARALVELFSDPFLSKGLRFRGGTALNKLHFPAPLRYSEDIDLVRTSAGPIRPLLDCLHDVLDPWLGKPRFDQSPIAPKLKYTVETEDWKEMKDGSVRIEQTIYVERESQKKIVIGKGGQAIKAISMAVLDRALGYLRKEGEELTLEAIPEGGLRAGAERLDLHAPGHVRGFVAQLVVIGHRADAPDYTAVQHALHSFHHLGGGRAGLIGNRVVGLRHAWQTGLRCQDDAPVEFVRLPARIHQPVWKRGVHASSLRPTKNSSCLGMLQTLYPVSCSMARITSSILSGVSVASTNHMLNS